MGRDKNKNGCFYGARHEENREKKRDATPSIKQVIEKESGKHCSVQPPDVSWFSRPARVYELGRKYRGKFASGMDERKMILVNSYNRKLRSLGMSLRGKSCTTESRVRKFRGAVSKRRRRMAREGTEIEFEK